MCNNFEIVYFLPNGLSTYDSDKYELKVKKEWYENEIKRIEDTISIYNEEVVKLLNKKKELEEALKED